MSFGICVQQLSVFPQEGTPLKCSMLVSHVASLWFYVVLLLSMIQPCGSALFLLYFSKSVFRKSLQEVWTGQEGTPWVASQLSTTSAQLFTQPSSPATWSLPWATPPRVFIAGYTGATEWQCHLNFTSYCWQRCWVSQDQPKLKLACFALNFTQCDWNWLHPTHPPQAEKDADSWKTSQNCNCD